MNTVIHVTKCNTHQQQRRSVAYKQVEDVCVCVSENDNSSQPNIATIRLDTKSARVALGMLQYDPMPCKYLSLCVLQ